MRYLRYAFLAVLAILLITVALANREPVTLRLMTDDLAAMAGFSGQITLPLFVVIFGGLVAGILVGFIWEWFREHKQRAQAAAHRREKDRLQREVSRLKATSAEPDDEILALLESSGAKR
ncbi:MAG: LapA family protein [Paracoccaceae bacterium]